MMYTIKLDYCFYKVRGNFLKVDSHSIWSIAAIVIMVILSAYFSATETAFTSFNRIRMKNMASDGNAKEKLVVRHSER